MTAPIIPVDQRDEIARLDAKARAAWAETFSLRRELAGAKQQWTGWAARAQSAENDTDLLQFKYDLLMANVLAMKLVAECGETWPTGILFGDSVTVQEIARDIHADWVRDGAELLAVQALEHIQ